MRNLLTFLGIGLISIGIFALVRYVAYPYHAHVVLSGSMGNQVPAGSLIVTKRKTPDAYRIGSVIMFLAPKPGRELVVHRITQVIQTREHSVELATKGDANASGDPWTITRGAVIGEVTFVLPWLGSVLRYLAYPSVFLAIALCTFCLLVLPVCLRAYKIIHT